jgi:hypothetical protein
MAKSKYPNFDAFGTDPLTGQWDAEVAARVMPVHVMNIRAKLANASSEDIKAGRHWYSNAYDHAVRIGGGNVEKGAGILAALSPALEWDANVEGGHHVAKTGTPFYLQTGANNKKALRILNGEHPLDVLGGHKVKSFYHNILNPDDPHEVTIDRHAHDIAIAKPFGKKGDKKADLGLSAAGRYNHFKEAYLIAAQQQGIAIPNQLQAATWVAHRNGS